MISNLDCGALHLPTIFQPAYVMRHRTVGLMSANRLIMLEQEINYGNAGIRNCG